MLGIRQAVQSIREYVSGFEDLLPISGSRLEEFDFDKSEQNWVVTMSFDDEIGRSRIYKTFVVDRTTGVVRSMKIRNIDLVDGGAY